MEQHFPAAILYVDIARLLHFTASTAPSTPLPSRPVHRSPASRQSHTSASHRPTPEHRRIPEHVRHDEQPHMAPPNVDAIEMSDAAIALGDIDVLELAVHVVFGFDQLAAVGLSGIDLDCDLVTLERMSR